MARSTTIYNIDSIAEIKSSYAHDRIIPHLGGDAIRGAYHALQQGNYKMVGSFLLHESQPDTTVGDALRMGELLNQAGVDGALTGPYIVPAEDPAKIEYAPNAVAVWQTAVPAQRQAKQ